MRGEPGGDEGVMAAAPAASAVVRRAWGVWLVLGVAALGIALLPAPPPPASPVERHLRIEARDFAYAPSTLVANPGDRITIELVAADVVHGLHLDGYDLEVTADPGRTARLTFVADRAGTFRFRCSVTCGPLHPFMIGELRVGPRWPWWRAIALAVVATVAGGVAVAQARTGARRPLA